MGISGILTFQNGFHFGHEINITAVTREKPAFIIGSDSRAHLCVNDSGVGISHAAITVQGGEYHIKSTLPGMRVYINGKLVDRAQVLHSGDVIRVGETELRFDIAERDLSDYPHMPPSPRVLARSAAPAMAAATTRGIYYPVPQNQSIAGGNPAVMVIGVAAIIGLIGFMAYMMIFNPVAVNTFLTGRPPIVYSEDAVTVVMFTASWCPYCRQQRPIINGLEREYDGMMRVRYIDIDDTRNRQLVAEYQATSIPLIIIFDNRGEIVVVYRGLTDAQYLVESIDQAIDAG